MKHTIYILILLLASCVSDKETLEPGSYLLNLYIEHDTIPINIEYKEGVIAVINGEEQIKSDSLLIYGDSIYFKLPIFNSFFKGKLKSTTEIAGVYTNAAKETIQEIPFSLRKEAPTKEEVLGAELKYKTLFTDSDGETYEALALLRKGKEYISGTFLTETGDYRYLAGKITGDNFYLSTFDGSHAFLFKAKFTTDSSIENGVFRSGLKYKETWQATRNDSFKLKDPTQLTYIKEGYSGIDFNFENLEGHSVSLKDSIFKNKVVIIQIMGSWCPNCLDETKYLAELYEENKVKGLEIIALAYEHSTNKEVAKQRVQALKNKIGAPYTFLLAGSSNKQEAAKTLPMLNHILSFPTTIVLDRKHTVKSIYTGFSGPGTGKYYKDYVKESNKLLNNLLNEKGA